MRYPEPAGSGAVGAPAGAARPDRSAAEIRRDVELQRRQLGRSVEVLRGRVAELTDWRRQLSQHRNELIAGAAIAGFVVGGIVALRRRR